MPWQSTSLNFTLVEQPSAQRSRGKLSSALSWKCMWFGNLRCCHSQGNDSSSQWGFAFCLRMFCNAARLYNSVAARSESLLISQLACERGGANPSNDDFPRSPLGLAGHRLISRNDPFLPPLCLCIRFHCCFYLLHYLLVLRRRGEEHWHKRESNCNSRIQQLNWEDVC